METQTKSCLLPLKKRADASFSSSTKRDRDNEYMQDHYGPRFCNNLPRQNSNPQKTHVPHLITLSAGQKKKIPSKKNWGKCFFQATHQQQLLCFAYCYCFPSSSIQYFTPHEYASHVNSIHCFAFQVPQTKLVTIFCALPHSLVLLYNATPFMLNLTPVFYPVTHLGFPSHHVRTINAPIKMRELLVICAFTDAIF